MGLNTFTNKRSSHRNTFILSLSSDNKRIKWQQFFLLHSYSSTLPAPWLSWGLHGLDGGFMALMAFMGERKTIC